MESVMLYAKDIVSSGRWDYDYNQVKYVDFEKKLQGLETAPLQSFCKQSITKGETPLWRGDKYVTEAEGILFIRSENIREYGLDLSSKTFIPVDVHKRVQRSQIQAGDVLLAIVGATIGQVSVVPDEIEEANCNQAVAIIRPREDVSSYYLRAVLQSSLGQTQIHRLSGGTARPNLDLWEARILRIPVVARPIQDQIAQVMQKAYEERRKKLREAEKLLHEISNHIANVLCIHVDTSKGERSFTIASSLILANKRWDYDYFEPKYQNVVERIIDSKYKFKRLDEIISVLTDGQHGYLEHLPSGVPLLRTTNIFENEIRLDGVKYIAPEVHAKLKRSQLKPGDVLLTTVGSIGIAAVVDKALGEANINQNLVKLTPKNDINPYYLASFLNSAIGRIQTERTASKSVVPIVSYSRLRSILIPVPPQAIQREIEKYMCSTLLEIRLLRSQAEAVVAAAKARVERMILGEESVESDQ